MSTSTDPPVLLVCEDDPAMATLLADMLERLPCQVAVCHSHADCISEFEGTAPVGIVLDLLMADGDGSEVIATIAASMPRTPLILVTAAGAERARRAEALADALNVPVAGTLFKPFAVETLRRLVGTLLPAPRPASTRNR